MLALLGNEDISANTNPQETILCMWQAWGIGSCNCQDYTPPSENDQTSLYVLARIPQFELWI